VRDNPWDPLAVMVAGVFGTRIAENHLGQRSPTAPTGRTYGCKRSDQTIEKLLRHGGRPHMGPGSRFAWPGRRRVRFNFQTAYPRHPEEHRESDASRRTTARAAHPSRLAQRCKCTARLAPPATTAKPLRGDDGLRYTSAISRRGAPEVLQEPLALRNRRAQGMPGAQCTRSLACEIKKHTSVVTTVTPEITRHSPRNGFTAYFALSPVTRLV